MKQYIITGGNPISGTVRCSGNKNAALPCIAAALLTDESVVLRNIPEIEDVDVMLKVFSTLGGTVKKLDAHNYRLHAANITSSEIPEKYAVLIRASILFAGPLLARVGRVVLPPPGGDVIGRRRLDTHFLALTELGARVQNIDGAFHFTAKKTRLAGCDLFLDEASVTATENAVMAAALAKGATVITNAACEPHVQDLCNMLNAMGARIEGVGSNILRISGVERLGGCEFAIGADYMEAGSFVGLAAATHGE
jgi:UDP-N-acetylglucosamine 1-carboxyvinyltransferase